MSGVTSSQRSQASSRAGIATLPWLKIDDALRSTSNTTTAAAGGPSAAITANLSSSDSRISNG